MTIGGKKFDSGNVLGAVRLPVRLEWPVLRISPGVPFFILPRIPLFSLHYEKEAGED